MSEYPRYDEIRFDRNVKLEIISKTPDNSDISYFVQVDSTYSYNRGEGTKHFSFWPENKIISEKDFNEYMKEINSKTSLPHKKKIIFNWTDKKTFSINYRMGKFYIGHVMIVDKNQEIISFNQRMSLEKFIDLFTKRSLAINDFKKVFSTVLIS